jgi:hypothetical protein
MARTWQINIDGHKSIIARFEFTYPEPGEYTMEGTAKPTPWLGIPVQAFITVYSYSGILPPINADGSSTFNRNGTIPVKFKLLDDEGNPVTDAKVKIYVAKVVGGSAGPDTEAVSTAKSNVGNLARYDAEGGQYIFNLDAKSLPETGTYQLKFKMGDTTLYTHSI